MIRILLFVLIALPSAVAFAASCPTGMVAMEYDNFVSAVSGACPSGYVAHDVDTVCGAGDGVCWIVEHLRELCGAGVIRLKTSGGLSFPLYSTRVTNPSLCVRYNDTTCYVDLEEGGVTDAININNNGVTYHTAK